MDSYYLDDEDAGVYYKIKVISHDGIRYVFNKRTLVRDVDSARKFFTMRSLKRCIRLGGFEEYEILKFSN